MLKTIPNSENIVIKKKFEEHYRRMLGDRYDDFLKYSFSYQRRSIRVNTLKADVDEIKKRLSQWNLQPVPWCKEGFWIEHSEGRRDIGNTTEHALGHIYVQESASMLPPVVLSPNAGDIVLDMCAAPGSKATQIAQYMNNEGLLIANDFKGDRLKALGINMQRCGISNCIITLMHGHKFRNAGIGFDKILVDAPCSGTGTIRKSLKTVEIWNPHAFKSLSGMQKQLLDTAFSILNKGGTIVYSTCSVEPEENEGVVDFLLKRHDDANIIKIKENIKTSPCVLEFGRNTYDERIGNCLRIWPQDNDTDGFFVAKIRKE